jgi:hypothetical protein
MSRLTSGALLAAAFLALPVAARAQDTGNGFLFGPPAGSFALRGGWALATAGSDLFGFTTNELTLRKRDFSSPEGAADLAFRIHPQTDLIFSVSVSGVKKGSEFRNFIDNNNLPIQQTTKFSRIPMTVGLKHYLTATGRSIGKFAWIPSRVTPYLGAAAGVMYYRFNQDGDFVDFNTSKVFHSTFGSDGWAPTGNINGGADFSLSPMFALTADARYVLSRGKLSQDFSGFNNLDLSGFSTTVGFAVRF